jgi:fluoride exporter
MLGAEEGGRKPGERASPAILGAVALGGGLGAGLRVAAGAGLMGVMGPAFPWGTFAVNLVGSSLFGFLSVRLPPHPVSTLRAFAIPGLCGGFTTFSAFGLEALALAGGGRTGAAAVYVMGSVAVCVLGAAAGRGVAGGAPGSGGRRPEPAKR